MEILPKNPAYSTNRGSDFKYYIIVFNHTAFILVNRDLFVSY